MKIIFNDLAKYRTRSGVGGYVSELSQRLGGHSFIKQLSQTSWGKPLTRAMGDASLKRNGLSQGLLNRFAHDSLAAYMRAAGYFSHYDLYHEPDFIPMLQRGRIVATVHDLSVLRFPEWHPAYRVRHYEKRALTACRLITRFIADSTQTKLDLETILGVPGDRIDVVHLAHRPLAPSLENTHDLSGPYFLFVGTIEPRKNILGMLEAYRMLPSQIRKSVPLVIAGGAGWKAEPILSRIRDYASYGVRYLGYLRDDDLARLYSRATAFVFPSFFEGFGLTPLEAMSHGAPVICSQTGSLKEIVGEAASLIDPNNPQSIAEAMERVFCDSNYAEDLKKRGRSWITRYSWEKTVEQTLQSYQRALAD